MFVDSNKENDTLYDVFIFSSWLKHDSAADLQLLPGLLRSDQLLHVPRRGRAPPRLAPHFPSE